MSSSRWLRGAVVAGAVVPVAVAMSAASGSANPGHRAEFGRQAPNQARAMDDGGEGGETQELMDRSEQFAAVRTAPGTSVSSLAYDAARRQAAAMPRLAGRWQEVTDQPYNTDVKGFQDPFWSNSGLGNGLTSGRTTALAVDRGTVWLGSAGGGVWKSTDHGRHWTPAFDQQAKLSIGAVAINPLDHSVWVGTGEANTNQDAFNGTGIYRSTDQGRSWQLVGNRLDQYLVSRISFDGKGYVYAATSRGLLRRSAIDMTSRWTVASKPDPNPTHSPYRTSFFTDVKVRPGTHGRQVLAALGWRGGTSPDDTQYNGFYWSTDSGRHFRRVAPTGALAHATDIGRTTFAYSADGRRLYAVVESSATVALKGVYKSFTGSPAGPWTLIADSDKLAKSGSVYARLGLEVGAQSWYNQDIAVDPKNADHVYLSLEEVFESTSAGKNWLAVGPYWNYTLPCYQRDPFSCPVTTHPDQHAIALAADGTGYFGNDGGVYSRRISYHKVHGWTDLNADLHTLQYYYAGIGKVAGGDAIWGGLQDNGASLLLPGRRQMVSPFGGDGGDVIVDPNNGNRSVQEYVYLNMARTENGGRSDGTKRTFITTTPSCANAEYSDIKPCDPAPRFIAPFEADVHNINHWVAGGEMVWDNQGKGWNTSCTPDKCDWKMVHDTGAGNSITALAVNRGTTYAAWCGTGNGCNPGTGIPFQSGIDTNYGGTWHRLATNGLPNRLITDIHVDANNAAHVVITFGGFSRHWIPTAGTGHVFESTDGGAHWRNVSGNLPDAPVDAVTMFKGKLVVGTDVGVFSRTSRTGWAVVGAGLPNTLTNDIVHSPDNSYLLAATHGRGLWKFSG